MNQDQVLSLIRWGLTAGGSYLVSTGKITAPDVATISGGLIALVSVGWSMFAHKGK